MSCQQLPAGRRVAIISNAGGAGVLAADACGDSGLAVAVLDSATQHKLTRLLPSGAAVAGPVDTTATVGISAFRACIEHVAAADNVDAVLAIAVPTAIADLTAAIVTADVSKPMAAVLLDRPESVSLLHVGSRPAGSGNAAGLGNRPCLPVYSYPETAARALGHAARYREWRDCHQGLIPELDDVDGMAARALVSAFLTNSPDGGWLPAADAVQLLASYRIPIVATRTVSSVEHALAAAKELGDHVVLKAEVDGLVHKTDAGAVKLDLRTPAEVAEAYGELAKAFGDRLRQVLVQPMLAGGVETLIGVVQEPVFGPLVVFGLGGVATDVLGDRAARLAPLTSDDANDMLSEVRAAPLLFGHRGSAAVNTAALADVLLRISRLADDLPEVAELDLNPVIATADGAHAVDVRIRLNPASPRDPFLRQLR